MRFRVSPPELLPDLVGYLQERVHLVVEQTGGEEVSVGVLGSFADGGAKELDDHLERWRASHPDAAVAPVADPLSPVPELEPW